MVAGSENRKRGEGWPALRGEVLERDEYRCGNCGDSSHLEVHHVVPVANGGTDRTGNLRTLCQRCHRAAHGWDTLETSDRRVKDRWTPGVDELRELVATTRHPVHRAIILTLLKTALGVGELCNLRLDDVYLFHPGAEARFPVATSGWRGDSPALRIRVPTAEDEYPGRRERRSDTFVPIDGELSDAILQMLAIRPDPESGMLFLDTAEKWGRPLTTSQVRNVVRSNTDEVNRHAPGESGKAITPLTLRQAFARHFPPGPVRGAVLGVNPSPPPWNELRSTYLRNIFTLT